MASRDIGPMSPKPSSPSEESDNRILRGYCGGKRLGGPCQCLHWAKGPAQNPSSAIVRILLGMDVAEDKGGNLPLVVTLQIVPWNRKSVKAEKDNGENESV